MNLHLSSKSLKFEHSNSPVASSLGIAVVVSVFCLVSARSLLAQANHQRKIVNAKNAAVKQLENNKSSASTLLNQYTSVFENSGATNAIGGRNDSSQGAVPPDGDNARIVLDSLPTSFDYPALISSVSKIMSDNGIANPSIGGTDASSSGTTSSTTPAPVPIVLQVSGNGPYANVKNLIREFERSTRPFDITKISLAGTDSSMSVSITVTTYYQPAKAFGISTTEVK